MSTHYFMAKSTGQSYYTETGDGRNRNLVICVNQLGGVGRGRSQFRANADGKRGAGCNGNDDIFTLIYSYTGLPLSIDFLGNYFILVSYNDFSNSTISNVNTYYAITNRHNSINLSQLPIYLNLNNATTIYQNGIDVPILSDKIYMLDLNNGDNYTGDASYINIYNNITFTKYDNSYSIYKPDIINSTYFFRNFSYSNALNLYYTNSTTKLGYWYFDTSENIRYNTNIEATDITNIYFTSFYGMSLNNFYVCAFDNNFAFTDYSDNLIMYFNGIYSQHLNNVIAIPITFRINNYGSYSNTNFITQEQYSGTLVMMIANRLIENVLQITRYSISSIITSLTIPIRNSLYNSLISKVELEQDIQDIQEQLYNISPNGQYLGLFNNLGFLEIYKFNGSKYNSHRRKIDINFFNPNILTIINSISNDGTIVSITRIFQYQDSNPNPFIQIYRLN